MSSDITLQQHDQQNLDSINYLALWHLERCSFIEARNYFLHLTKQRPEDAQLWLSLCVCCALGDAIIESDEALATAANLLIFPSSLSLPDARISFCEGLILEKKNDYSSAMNKYNNCIQLADNRLRISESSGVDSSKGHYTSIFVDLKGDSYIRMAMIHKEVGDLESSMTVCDHLISPINTFSLSVRSNALTLKGLLHEMKGEYPVAEIVYRSVLQQMPGHTTAMERLGRVYLRYRETVPAAMQCFLKSIEIDPSGPTAWYLLGRCYMATAQYSEAWEAYNRSVNLNPNNATIWCSLGVLYYSYGQYKEALGMFCRAIRLEPNMSDAWYNVGALYDMANQPEDAQKAYLRAKETGLSRHFEAPSAMFKKGMQVYSANPVDPELPTLPVPQHLTDLSSTYMSTFRDETIESGSENFLACSTDSRTVTSSSFVTQSYPTTSSGAAANASTSTWAPSDNSDASTIF